MEHSVDESGSRYGFHEVLLDDDSLTQSKPNKLFTLSSAYPSQYYLQTKEEFTQLPQCINWSSSGESSSICHNGCEDNPAQKKTSSSCCSRSGSSVGEISLSSWTKKSSKDKKPSIPCVRLKQLMSFNRTWAFQLKILQIIGGVSALIAILYILVSKSNSQQRANNASLQSQLPIPEKFVFNSWLINSSDEKYYPPSANTLLDLRNFKFLLNNASKCGSEDAIFMMILVHSAPENRDARQAIRETWGSRENIQDSSIRLAFLLGKSESEDLKLERESNLYGDLVQGNFVDSYRNLSYKHLMGYKWALKYCPSTTFVLKTDDDAFIALFQLVDFIRRNFGARPTNTLICNVMPEGTRPVRFVDIENTTADINLQPQRVNKWSVTKGEYVDERYPKYCSGLAYLATTDVLRDFYEISGRVKYLWIDDVFVTGIIRDLAKVEPFYLNLRYLYEPQKYRKWLERDHTENENTRVLFRRNIEIKRKGGQEGESSHHFQPQRRMRLPFTFVHLERGNFMTADMHKLWNKVVRKE